MILEVVPEQELLKTKLGETILYDEDTFPWKTGGSIFLAATALSLFWLAKIKIRRNRLIYIYQNNVSYRRKTIGLDPSAIKILKALVQAEGKLSSPEVLLLSENRSFTEAHNLKIKNQIIDSINLRLKTLVGEPEDLIVTSKSSEDRRMKSYTIDYKRFMVKV